MIIWNMKLMKAEILTSTDLYKIFVNFIKLVYYALQFLEHNLLFLNVESIYFKLEWLYNFENICEDI